MEFLVYAFAGVGVVATIWFFVTAAEKAWPQQTQDPLGDLADRIDALERRVP